MAKDSDETKIDSTTISNKRFNLTGIQETILGGLAFLNDTHVYDSGNFSGTHFDFLVTKRKSELLAALLRTLIGKVFITEYHLPGTWPSFIHYMPGFTKSRLKPLTVVTDYNLFTTVSTAYPLFLFDDRNLAEGQRFVSAMLSGANKAVCSFKRGDAYNFWLTRIDGEKHFSHSAPLNIPIWLVDLRCKVYKYTGLLGLKKFYESDILFNWIKECYENKSNKTQGSAIFNIPDDADNTSMAIIFRILYQRIKHQPVPGEILSPLSKATNFRDIGRNKSDIHNDPLMRNTGAFLTWFKDENLPIFANPNDGIIPLSVNNVDLVINSNVIFALSLSRNESLPGYSETLAFLSSMIVSGKWKEASLYYPQKMVFPYTISRAWRDTGIKNSEFEKFLAELMKQIIAEQESFEKENPELEGAFPDGEKREIVFSTALGLNALINLGQPIAEIAGLVETFDRLIEKSVGFLLKNFRQRSAKQKNTKTNFIGIKPVYWESGVLYSSSLKQLAHWRSHAQTTSLVIEALSKYILSYDTGESEFLSRRICLSVHDDRLILKLPS